MTWGIWKGTGVARGGSRVRGVGEETDVRGCENAERVMMMNGGSAVARRVAGTEARTVRGLGRGWVRLTRASASVGGVVAC